MSLFGTKAVSALRVGHRLLLTFGSVFGASDLQKIQPFVEFSFGGLAANETHAFRVPASH